MHAGRGVMSERSPNNFTCHIAAIENRARKRIAMKNPMVAIKKIRGELLVLKRTGIEATFACVDKLFVDPIRKIKSNNTASFNECVRISLAADGCSRLMPPVGVQGCRASGMAL